MKGLVPCALFIERAEGAWDRVHGYPRAFRGKTSRIGVMMPERKSEWVVGVIIGILSEGRRRDERVREWKGGCGSVVSVLFCCRA